jgi:hypothetical protein
LLKFKKTSANQKSFCDFIEKKYKTTKLLETIHCSETFFKKINNTKLKSFNKNNNERIDELQFLTNNLRMTICEMG